MAWEDMYGHLHDGSPPAYDDTNGQPYDPPPPRRLRSRNWRGDPQHISAGLWVTREGCAVRITAMSDSHLTNSMKLLERGARSRAMAEAFGASRYAETAPDGASDAANDAARELFDLAHDKDTDLAKLAELVFPKYRELKQELKRRG